jgi:hypothetical protein
MEESERIQNVTDKAKAISLLNNLHNLSPPVAKTDDSLGKVAIIEALKVSPRLQHLFLEIQGLVYSDDQKEIMQVARPIMNIHGAFRFVKILQHISEEVEWSNYPEDEINRRIFEHYKSNYPYFTFWHKEYDLEPSDFNYISTTLMSFIDAAFHKAKGAKFINAVSRVYSEDFLGKALQSQDDKKKKASFFSALNPLRRSGGSN